MTATLDVQPGELNLKLVAGDDLDISLDFDIDLSGYTFSAFIGGTEMTVIPTVLDAGQLTLRLTDAQSTALGPGSFEWYLTWTFGTATRTVLKGVAQVVAR